MAGVMLSSATSAPDPTPPAVLVIGMGFEIVKSGFFDPFGLKLKNEAGDSDLALSLSLTRPPCPRLCEWPRA